MKRVLRNLGFSAIMAVVVLGGAELFLRLVSEPSLYIDEHTPIWRLRPDIQRPVRFVERGTEFGVRTNALGWRGDEPQPGALLCLGDSTTFGWGVEEDEAWPALVDGAVNGGVPGYSTFQGLARIDEAMSTEPSQVLLAFLVRDAELAPMADHERPSVSAPSNLALLRTIRSLRPAPGPRDGPAVHRVPPERYRANLVALIEQVRSAGAEPLLFAFPMVEQANEHLAVLEELADAEGIPLFAPELDHGLFFEEDPIHLTVEGNARLAEALEGWL
ncbi:MAG TPA: hypothetical protein QGF58_17185 [Myxococcota bacterium]|nr:hypothetical protein [Myxococcota bacterium]